MIELPDRRRKEKEKVRIHV